jgi:hypothetical protein
MGDTLSVFEALSSLGFVNRNGFGLEFIHPQIELEAVESNNPWPPEHIVSFAGRFNRGREFGFLEFNLPATVESLEQLKAFLAYHLSDAMTINVPDWITEGRALSHLLPWERDAASYATRDRCTVRREWLKLALKDLADALKNLQLAEEVKFTFDGSVVSIDCGRRIIVQAEGSAWREACRVRVRELTPLPTRIKHDPTQLEVWDSHLIIGGCSYPLADPVRDSNPAASSS